MLLYHRPRGLVIKNNGQIKRIFVVTASDQVSIRDESFRNLHAVGCFSTSQITIINMKDGTLLSTSTVHETFQRWIRYAGAKTLEDKRFLAQTTTKNAQLNVQYNETYFMLWRWFYEVPKQHEGLLCLGSPFLVLSQSDGSGIECDYSGEIPETRAEGLRLSVLLLSESAKSIQSQIIEENGSQGYDALIPMPELREDYRPPLPLDASRLERIQEKWHKFRSKKQIKRGKELRAIEQAKNLRELKPLDSGVNVDEAPSSSRACVSLDS
jgi:hypothetical protein